MKKIVMALAAVVLIFNACTTEKDPDPVTVSLDKTSDSGITLVNTHRHIMLSVTNSTSDVATIKWERAETVAGPTAWTHKVNGSSATTGTLTIAAGATTEVTIMIDPMNVSGTSTGTVTFYDEADKASTSKMFTYDVTTVNNYFTTSPNGFLSDTDRADTEHDYHIWVVNPNDVPVTVRWRRANESGNPNGWAVVVCTDETCYTESIMTQLIFLGAAGSTATIPPNDSVDYKCTVTPNSIIGDGGTDALFYIEEDSTNSVVTHPIRHSAT